jgi:hypothetical protein
MPRIGRIPCAVLIAMTLFGRGAGEDVKAESESSLTITDKNGKVFEVSDWGLRFEKIRTNAIEGKLGLATIRTPMSEISEIQFLGNDPGIPGVSVTIVRKDGESISLSGVSFSHKIEGQHKHGELLIDFSLIKKVVVANLSVKRCEKCSREYANKDWKYCPFDADELK